METSPMPDERTEEMTDLALKHFEQIGNDLKDNEGEVMVEEMAQIMVAITLAYLVWAFEGRGQHEVRAAMKSYKALLDDGLNGIYDDNIHEFGYFESEN